SPLSTRPSPATGSSRATGRPRKGPVQGAGRRPRPPLTVEALEDRSLLATAVSVADPSLIADTAGGINNTPATGADAPYVASQPTAPTAVAGQPAPANLPNVFLFDRLLGTTTLVSHTPSSATGTANGASTNPALSADGRFVAYVSTA